MYILLDLGTRPASNRYYQDSQANMDHGLILVCLMCQYRSLDVAPHNISFYCWRVSMVHTSLPSNSHGDLAGSSNCLNTCLEPNWYYRDGQAGLASNKLNLPCLHLYDHTVSIPSSDRTWCYRHGTSKTSTLTLYYHTWICKHYQLDTASKSSPVWYHYQLNISACAIPIIPLQWRK